jgi:NAD+ diphosphatase
VSIGSSCHLPAMSAIPRFVPALRKTESAAESVYFVFHRRKLVLVEGNVPGEDPRTLGFVITEEHYLGRLGDLDVHAASLAEDAELPEASSSHELIALYGTLPEPLHALAGRAVQVVDWARTHRFCGACGTPTVPSETARSRVCPSCKLEAFPRLSPAIIVAVERGDEILLARSPHFPAGIYSVLAGFVDPGESVEDAVRREVMEEVGLEIENVRYFSSQPWPYPNSLMLGFQADYVSGEVTPQPGEIEDAAFYRCDAMPRTFPGRRSISQWLIADFLARRGG